MKGEPLVIELAMGWSVRAIYNPLTLHLIHYHSIRLGGTGVLWILPMHFSAQRTRELHAVHTDIMIHHLKNSPLKGTPGN